jgi:hypothetical protein
MTLSGPKDFTDSGGVHRNGQKYAAGGDDLGGGRLQDARFHPAEGQRRQAGPCRGKEAWQFGFCDQMGLRGGSLITSNAGRGPRRITH